MFSAAAAKNDTVVRMNPISRAPAPDRFFLRVHGKAMGISKVPVCELTTAAEGLEVANPASHLLAAIKAEVEHRQISSLHHNAG